MSYDSIKSFACIMLQLLVGVAAWAQGEYDPQNPPDPHMLYKVVATANEGNYASGSGQYVTGTQVTLNTSAQSTVYAFRYWMKNGVQYTTDKQFTYTVTNENINFQAVYEYNPDNPSDPQSINERRLYLVPDPEGACSFSRTSGAKAEAGNVVSVTAYASQGFVFDGWYDTEDNLLANTSTCNYTMPDANATLIARFTYSPVMPGDPESSMTEEDWQCGIKGDIDGDGELSVTDVVIMVNVVMGTSSAESITKYDMDDDGELSVTDVVMLVNLVMNN